MTTAARRPSRGGAGTGAWWRRFPGPAGLGEDGRCALEEMVAVPWKMRSPRGARTRTKLRYSTEPVDRLGYRRRFDRFYGRTARLYDVLVKVVPIWRHWLRQTLPVVKGPRVLEVSFGTGYLLTRYAQRVEAHGVDLNARMVDVATQNLHRAGVAADLRQGDVEALPYPDGYFDTVLCTAALSGYPDGHRAMAEMLRVMKPDGRLVILDVGYPADANRLGIAVTYLWMLTGDLIRDMTALFDDFGLQVTDQDVGAWGSWHLWVATRADSPLEAG